MNDLNFLPEMCPVHFKIQTVAVTSPYPGYNPSFPCCHSKSVFCTPQPLLHNVTPMSHL